MAEKQWEVTSRDGNRRLFSGTEDDARDFIENNFPRVHAEPGQLYGDDGPQPDVVLVSPGQGNQKGKKEGFDGNDWKDVK